MCENLPNEILEHIFFHLPPKDLFTCRVVCLRWKKIVSNLTRRKTLWRLHCRQDYPDIWESAYKKSHSGLSWYFLYRSLTLWPKLQYARVTVREFAMSEHYEDDIRDFYVLSDGVIGVHRKEAIVYYDLHTLRPSKRGKITGRYLFYRENDNILLTQGNNNSLSVTWKKTKMQKSKANIEIQDIKAFFLLDNVVYFAKLNDEILSCKLVNGKIIQTKLIQVEDCVASLGYRHNYVYILTSTKIIFKLVDKKLVTVLNLQDMSFMQIFSELKKYDFQREVVFSYCSWFYASIKYYNETLCILPYCDKTILYSYGNILISGSQFGNVCIHYVPNINNILNSVELQHFNLMQNYDWSTPRSSGIIQIHVVESYDSHIVLVALSNKITVLKFIH